MTTLQTLDRGIDALLLVSTREDGVTVRDIAEHLDVHRAIAHRLVATLEARGLVARGSGGRYRLGPTVPVLSSRYAPHLIEVVRPELRELCRSTGATAFLCVAHGDQCTAVAVEEPPDSVISVSYRVGSTHPLTRGAAGLAVLAARPFEPGEPEAVTQGREQGWVRTSGELQPGACGLATGLGSPASVGAEASVGIVVVGELDSVVAGARVVESRHRARAALGLT